jgi:hypothetical protein
MQAVTLSEPNRYYVINFRQVSTEPPSYNLSTDLILQKDIKLYSTKCAKYCMSYKIQSVVP